MILLRKQTIMMPVRNKITLDIAGEQHGFMKGKNSVILQFD